jgi:hypothetical protein
MTRLIFAELTLVAAALTQPGLGEAAPYWPWCSQYGPGSFAHACAFSSWEQCMETVRGGAGVATPIRTLRRRPPGSQSRAVTARGVDSCFPPRLARWDFAI